jgi:hypothetical protein
MKRLLLFFFLFVSGFISSQTTAFSETFDSGNSLTLVNGTATNKWFRGTANNCVSGASLYISNNSSAYSYTNTSTSIVHAYFDVVIPAGSTTITLNFYRKVAGEASYDDLKIWSCVNTFTPTVGTQVTANSTNRVLLGTIQGQTTCAQTSYTLPNTIAGTTRRIIFTWRNDISGGVNPPALLDNITVTYAAPSAPSCSAITAPTNSGTGISLSQTLQWAASTGATGYDVYFGTSASPPLVSTNQAGTTYTPTLAGGTLYYWKVVAKNSIGSATGCSTWSFTTASPPTNDACSGATSLPCGTSSLAGTTVNTVSETAPLGYSSNFGVWYQFTGDGSSTTISSTATFDHELDIMTGTSCGSFSIISAVDNSTTTETYTFTTTNGQQYYIYISHYNPGSTTTGTFTISRTCVTPPTNNNCSSAPSLTVNSSTTCTSTTNGTTVGATQSSTSCVGTADDDVWYSFVATQTSQTITVTPGTMSDAVFQVYSGTCSGLTSLACIDNTLGSSSETTTVTSLTIGSTYYVRVHSYGNGTGQGTFSICATSPCSTPTTSGTLTANLYSTTVNDAVTFTTTGNGGTITLFEWSYDNFSTVAGTTNNPANPYTLILNVQQPTMYFRTTSVSGTCPAGATTPISVTLASAPAYAYGTEDGDYISNVTLNTINNNSTYDPPLGDSYQDFTSISTTLIKGASYTISVSSPVTFAGTASGYAVWIDFDNDGIFEVSENIMLKAPSTTQSQTFTVPSGAATALVKMRILSTWSATPTTDAYNSAGYNWGEIEEYKINIQAALPIELVSFEGINKGVNNILFWSTSTEHNSNYFNVQKSRDGETWQTISTINGAGNSTVLIDYSIVDYEVEPIINYYRLQQYDFDGTYEIYGPIAINNMDMGVKTIVKLLNLAGQEISFEQATAAGVYIEVYSDGTSKKVYR